MTNQIQEFPPKTVEEMIGNLSLDDILKVKSVCNKSLERLSSLKLTFVKIERVPPEILEEIFDNLPQKDIANARLVCRKWMEISSPSYLNALTITLRTGPLITANFVAEHEIFRRGIKLLVIDIAQFSRILALGRRQYATAIIKQLLREMRGKIGDELKKLDLMEAVMRWRDFPTVSAEAAVEAWIPYSEGDDGKPCRNNPRLPY